MDSVYCCHNLDVYKERALHAFSHYSYVGYTSSTPHDYPPGFAKYTGTIPQHIRNNASLSWMDLYCLVLESAFPSRSPCTGDFRVSEYDFMSLAKPYLLESCNHYYSPYIPMASSSPLDIYRTSSFLACSLGFVSS